MHKHRAPRCSPQAGGVAALTQGEALVAQLRAQYRQGRDLVTAKLGRDSRLELSEPAGAFYAFPRLPGLRDSVALAQGLLDEEDVGVAPGNTFGPGNDEHFRLCFARSPAQLEEALDRIVRYLDRHHNDLIGR